MSFLAYILAWVFIITVFYAVYAICVKFKNFILRITPLGDRFRKREEEHYRKIASYVSDELKKG